MTVSTQIAEDRRTSPADLLAVARRYAARTEDWPLAPKFDAVQRWYHRLADEPHLQVWLLSWLPGQNTGLHDHGGSSGAFVVVSGTLREYTTTVRRPGDRVTRLAEAAISTGGGRAFGPHHIHNIVNTTAEPAVSLHVYGPALREMTRYRVEEGRLRVTAVERAGLDW